MVAFTKQILRPGTYSVPTPGKPSERQDVVVDKARIKGWIETFNLMKNNGLNIPAPYRHDPRSIPLRLQGDQQDIDAYQNAGFWTELHQDKDGSLQGTLEVPDDDNADKIGNTIVEVSPLAKPKWEDGEGNEYEDAITHIALVTHPVVPGQENFKPRSKQYRELAASHIFSSENLVLANDTMAKQSTVSIQDLLKELKEAVGVVLPDDTDEPNFSERLLTALIAIRNKPSEDGKSGTTRTPPKDSETEPNPIALSQEDTMDKIRYSPYTGKELTEEETATMVASLTKTDVQLSQEDQATINYARKIGRQAYVQRVENLVNSGRVNPKYAQNQIKPLLDDLQLSFDEEGTPVAGSLDLVLGALESLPEGSTLTGRNALAVKKSKGIFGNAFSLSAEMKEEELPVPLEETDEDIESLVESQLKLAGGVA